MGEEAVRGVDWEQEMAGGPTLFVWALHLGCCY